MSQRMFVPNLGEKLSQKSVPCLSRMGDLLNTQRNVQNFRPGGVPGGVPGGPPGGCPRGGLWAPGPDRGGDPPGDPPGCALVNGPLYAALLGLPDPCSPKGGRPPLGPPGKCTLPSADA